MDPFAERKKLKIYGWQLKQDLRVPFMGAISTSAGDGGFKVATLFGVDFFMVPPPIHNESMASICSKFPCWSIDRVNEGDQVERAAPFRQAYYVYGIHCKHPDLHSTRGRIGYAISIAFNCIKCKISIIKRDQ